MYLLQITEVVVNALFSSNESCRLEISESQYLNDTSTIKNIGSANVFLYEDDLLIEELSYLPPIPGENLGNYTSNFKKFVKGRRYSIKAELAGQSTISASDIIPFGGTSVANFIGPSTSDTSSKDLNFELDLKQLNTEKQYFHMLLQQRWVEYSIPPADSNLIYSPWFDKAIFPKDNPIGFIPTPSEPFSLNAGGLLQGIMLDNQNFVNSSKSIGFWTSNSKQEQANMYLESRIIVRSVSENYFKYYFSSSQYYRTKGTPLTEPVIIHNNITNGLGNFSGYSSDTSAVIATFY